MPDREPAPDPEPLAGGPGGGPRQRPPIPQSWRPRSWRWLAWPVVLAVVAVALAVGAGAFKAGEGAPESLYQRTLQIAGQYRCPVCADESAAVSDAPAAVQIRDQIHSWLSSGWDQQRIRSALVHDYGVSILERPPTSGASALVWVLPALAAAAALAGLGFAFARWRRAPPGTSELGPSFAGAAPPQVDDWREPCDLPSVTIGAPGVTTMAHGVTASGVTASGVTRRVAVLDEPAVTRRPGAVLALGVGGPVTDGTGPRAPSGTVLPDGPLSPQAEETSGNGDQEPLSPDGKARWGQRALLVAGTGLVVLAGALWVFDRTAAPRPSGQTTSKGSTSITAELEAAASLAQKDPVSALVLYQQVLSTDPGQPVALASEGWIYAQGGYVKTGLALLEKAEAADPSYAPPHLYRGLVLLDQAAQPAAAASELNWYLHHGPAGSEVQVARSALARAEALLKRKGS